MSFVGRLIGEKPPTIPATASVRLASAPVPGIVEGTLEQHAYW